jgi:hypothetical protein
LGHTHATWGIRMQLGAYTCTYVSLSASVSIDSMSMHPDCQCVCVCVCVCVVCSGKCDMCRMDEKMGDRESKDGGAGG